MEVITLIFRYKFKKFKVKISAGKRMMKPMVKMAKRVGREMKELKNMVKSTGAMVAGGEQVDQFREDVIFLKEKE